MATFPEPRELEEADSPQARPLSSAAAAAASRGRRGSGSSINGSVIVSGRCGHNERMNGVFMELPDLHCGFPAYHDAQRNVFIYRRRDPAVWTIGNRLGAAVLVGSEERAAAGRAGRGIVFAENSEDVSQPYLVTTPWTVAAWGCHPAEEDPKVQVYFRAEGAREAPAPTLLAVRSRLRPAASGSYLPKGVFNNKPLYVRSGDDSPGQERCLFWDGECWCIAADAGATPSACDARSQRREIPGGAGHPDDAVWRGVEVLRGDGSSRIEASLLASLKGRALAVARRFSG
eukprot:TRINITY_DN23184_c0_g1_i1.p2 TRINITY_DN23184_c0_g1~~TRINITY_DN23184_c0_g1_i1.p2  ORF type:complete len:303 (-),score=60.41 TRINITY_DN23184_c0_g1_i1:115-978(-)